MWRRHHHEQEGNYWSLTERKKGFRWRFRRKREDSGKFEGLHEWQRGKRMGGSLGEGRKKSESGRGLVLEGGRPEETQNSTGASGVSTEIQRLPRSPPSAKPLWAHCEELAATSICPSHDGVGLHLLHLPSLLIYFLLMILAPVYPGSARRR